MTQIHLFGGEKGGVGKSFVCRTAIAYHLNKKIDCVPFDADRSNADVLRIYGEKADVRSAILSEGEDYEKAAHDILMTALDGQRVLVNLPAQAMPALMLSVLFLNNQSLVQQVGSQRALMLEQRKELSWLLEKASRAECFEGIRGPDHPQCQQYDL